MKLKAGDWTDRADSMLEAIEAAFRENWPDVMGDAELPDEINQQMRLVFVAIAQGVVEHLANCDESFKVITDEHGSLTRDIEITTE